MIRAIARPAVRITQRRCASTSATPAVPLQNLEMRWATLSAQEQASVAKHLEQIQAGEWTKMTAEQKKAGTSTQLFSFVCLFYSIQENGSMEVDI
jgi:cytochrome c oxidase subunit 4